MIRDILLAYIEVWDSIGIMLKLSDSLRQAIEKCGESRYRIAQKTGINESTLSRFMGGAAITSDNADRLAEYLGLELIAAKSRNKPSNRG